MPLASVLHENAQHQLQRLDYEKSIEVNDSLRWVGFHMDMHKHVNLGDSFTKAYATLDYEFFKNHHLNVSANFAKIGDDIFLQNEWVDILSYSGYAAGYGIDTVFGPIELKYNWSPDTNYSAYLISVGYWF